MTDLLDKLDTVHLNTGRHKGTTKAMAVPRDDGPGFAGVQVEHWNGRVDATVFAPATHLVARTVLLDHGDRPVVVDQRGPRRGHPLAQGGAVTDSGLFVIPWGDLFDGSDMILDWVNDTVKYALFTNSISPSFSTNTAITASPFNANQVTGTGYTAGGVSLASKTVTESPTGTLMFDANDPSWSGATFSGARCGVAWDDTITSPTADPVIALQNYGADFGVTAGVFTVQLASAGLTTLDLTP